MNNFIENCRNNPSKAIMQLLKKAFAQNLLSCIVLFVLFGIAVVPLMLIIAYNYIPKDLINSKNPDPEKFFQYFNNPTDSVWALFSLFILVGLLGIYFASSLMAVILSNQDSKIREQNQGFGYNIFGALGKPALKIGFGFLSIYILIVCITILLQFTLLSFVMNSNPFLSGFFTLLLMIVYLITITRLALFPAAIVHGRMGILNSIRFSWSKITFKRSAMILLMAIVAGVVFGLAFLLLAFLVSGIEQALGSAGSFIGMLLFMFAAAFAYQFMYSSLSVLYFRYSDETNQMDTSEHLDEFSI